MRGSGSAEVVGDAVAGRRFILNKRFLGTGYTHRQGRLTIFT